METHKLPDDTKHQVYQRKAFRKSEKTKTTKKQTKEKDKRKRKKTQREQNKAKRKKRNTKDKTKPTIFAVDDILSTNVDELDAKLGDTLNERVLCRRVQRGEKREENKKIFFIDLFVPGWLELGRWRLTLVQHRFQSRRG